MTGERATKAGPAAYPRLEVLETGPLALVQDRGRPGLSELGVGPSGAADRGAHALGARLLGQDTDRAAIEVHHGGLALRAHGAVTVVLTGAPTTATVDGRRVGHAAPFTVGDGAVLDLGRPTSGLRTYVSVRGGIEVGLVLGSRSYDTLSAIGPAPLRRGDLLPIGIAAGQPTVDVAPVPTPSTGTVTLELLPGPRRDWLADVSELTSSPWSVDPASDRVGLRLDGAALTRSPQFEDRELPSEGVVRGAVQVPADGCPVVFLADHPVTGGYPVVAVLTERSADLAAQLVPGQAVRFRTASSRR
ncbi:5-oxoprolinase subunit C family protein [Pedococcus sp. P5_B7]